MNTTIEEKVAETLLQRPAKIQIGTQSYQVSPPSVATLILVSEAVSSLPQLKLDDTNVVGGCLAIAKDCKALGDIAAILILGAKEISKSPQQSIWDKCKAFFTRKPQPTVKENLAKAILENYPPNELNALIAKLLHGLNLGDFFALTTFLTEINLLKATKVGN